MEEASHMENHYRGLHGTLDAKTENLVLFCFFVLFLGSCVMAGRGDPMAI